MMPGGNFNGANFKQGLIAAAPMFNAMAAGYASGRGPYAYMDQGAAMIQENMKRKRDEEAAAAAAAAFSGLMTPGGMVPGGLGMATKGGGFPVSTAPRNPMDPTSISGDTMAALGKDSGTAGYRASLIGTESGGNWRASNNETGAGGKKGHFGRVQFGQARLQEAMNAGAIPQGTTPEQFMNSPALQIAAENWHFADLESKLGDLVGTVVNGKPMDMGALVAMGHLGGAGGARRYVESGGQYNPSDSFGTSLADYAATHGGQPVTMSAKGEATIPTGPVDPMTDPYVQQLMGVMAMPGLTPEQRSVVEMQLQSRIQTITTPDPAAEEDRARAMRARDAELLGYIPGTAEFNRYVVTGNMPGDTGTPAGFRELQLRAEASGLVPGTPDYERFMLSGGGGIGESRPAAFEALHLQALAAGFPEGTPEYKEFMATRGAGLAAESKAIGEAKGAATAGAPAEVQAADETLGFIDEVRKHPGLDQGTGMSSVFNAIPGTSGYDFQNRVDQLLSGGFLTAIDQLRGMGALSNAEGQTATRAISRMDTATSKEEFLAALADYERVVKQGRERAQSRLPAPDGGAAQGATAPITGTTSGGVQWSIE